MRRFAVLSLVLASTLATGQSSPARLSTVDLLNRYASGQFAQVVEYVSGDVDFGGLLKELRRDGPGWIDAAGPQMRPRRELAAATFALEAARAGEWREWKLIQKQPEYPDVQVLNVLYWKAPPLLIEWGCTLMRQRTAPDPIERWWQLAALAVAQRSEDPQFLVGDTNIGRGVAAGEIGNIQDEIKHLEHVRKRFPNEPRFLLAEGIARDIDWTDDATQVYQALANDPDVGGEATMRFGAMRMRQRKFDDAIERFRRAERLTRDPYVIFLGRYFTAQMLERQGEREDAEDAYRGAVAAVPDAQSATVALAALIFRGGRRSEAQQLMERMLTADPAPVDPWRAFVHADDRFWPQLIGHLRAEISK
jgi:tetratricopeptide (TPR) repeat protein